MIRALILAGILISTGCATRYKEDIVGWSEENGKGLGLRVVHVALKRKKVVAEISLINNYDFDVVVPVNSVRATVDGEGGFMPRSNARVVLAPNDRIKGKYTFVFDKKTNEAEKISFKVEYLYRGTEGTAIVSETSSRSIGSAVGTAYHGLASAIGSSRTNSRVVTNELLSIKEGDRLKPVIVDFFVPVTR